MRATHGFTPKTAWIAQVKEAHGLPVRQTHNRQPSSRVVPCPLSRQPAIVEALRPKLLLTFGSPLDKIAFVFTTQPRKGATTAVREALAAVVQPLIDNLPQRRGIHWLNIYSRWDIISGRLDFYDDPRNRLPPVENLPDPEAVTFLGAHTEYWRNWLLFERLHRAVT